MTKITPSSKKKVGLGMGMSLGTAESISAVANVAFLGSLIVGVIAAFFIYVTAGVKETAFKHALSEANVEIAKARASGAQAQAVAAEANAAAEKARESAATAQERAASLENEAAQARMREAILKRQLLEVQRQTRKAPF